MFDPKMSDVCLLLCAQQGRKSWCHGEKKNETKRQRKIINEKSGGENEEKILYDLKAVFIFCSQPEELACNVCLCVSQKEMLLLSQPECVIYCIQNDLSLRQSPFFSSVSSGVNNVPLF